MKKTHIRPNNDLLPTRDMCSTVFLDELKPIWSRAGIPIKADKKCIDMTVELWESFLKLKQVPKSRRDKKIIEFQGIQNCLFDLSPINVHYLMQSTQSDVWEEDYKFLEMQRLYPQEGSMGVVDVVTYNREKKKMARKAGVKSKSDLSIVSSGQQSDSEVSDDELEDISSGDEVDETTLNRSTNSTPRPHSVTLEVPRSLSRCLSTTSDRRHLSVRDQSAIQKALLESANVNF